jgi:NAD(P)-dependent dehydrogenase (short-subunit alcohol dehydrogenase family)
VIAVRGASSKIAQALQSLLPSDEQWWRVGRADAVPLSADRYLFCQGVMKPASIAEQSDEQIALAFFVNAAAVIQDCDAIIAGNDRARICVIGSESGFAWSHDGAYAASKAGLHRYVETKRLRTEHQQLVCVAPGIIRDAGMTMRRSDHVNLVRRRMEHPKRRFLDSAEVARTVHHVLYVDRGYLSGVVIRLNGGEHTR